MCVLTLLHFPDYDDLSRTPTAGPSRLHVLQDESEDTDATLRLTISASRSITVLYIMTEGTPAAAAHTACPTAQVPNTSSISWTQLLLHFQIPNLTSNPPRWANLSTNWSSAH